MIWRRGRHHGHRADQAQQCVATDQHGEPGGHPISVDRNPVDADRLEAMKAVIWTRKPVLWREDRSIYVLILESICIQPAPRMRMGQTLSDLYGRYRAKDRAMDRLL
jgi:hypothetical protein